MTKHKIVPTTSVNVTVIMTNNGGTKQTKSYKTATGAADHYADYSTLNWDYGRKRNDPNYQFDFDRYHNYKARVYRRALKYFQQFMK